MCLKNNNKKKNNDVKRRWLWNNWKRKMLKQISVWSAESCRCFVFPTVAVLPNLFVSMKHVHVLMLWTVEQEQPDDKLSSHLSASLIKTESVRSEKRFLIFFFNLLISLERCFSGRTLRLTKCAKLSDEQSVFGGCCSLTLQPRSAWYLPLDGSVFYKATFCRGRQGFFFVFSMPTTAWSIFRIHKIFADFLFEINHPQNKTVFSLRNSNKWKTHLIFAFYCTNHKEHQEAWSEPSQQILFLP